MVYNYIPEAIRKTVSNFKDKVSLFMTSAPKQTMSDDANEVVDGLFDSLRSRQCSNINEKK